MPARWLAALSLALTAALCLGAAAPRRIPPQVVTLEYRLGDRLPITAVVRDAAGQPAYWLILRAQDAAGSRAPDLELMLADRITGRAPNRFEPPMWHGVEPFFFDGFDFRDGVAKSVYGPQRRMPVFGAPIRASVTILQATARQGPDGGELDYDLQALRLAVRLSDTRAAGRD